MPIEAWSQRVLDAIDERVEVQPGDMVEFQPAPSTESLGWRRVDCPGCQIQNPTLGMGIGFQLRFYKQAWSG